MRTPPVFPAEAVLLQLVLQPRQLREGPPQSPLIGRQAEAEALPQQSRLAILAGQGAPQTETPAADLQHPAAAPGGQQRVLAPEGLVQGVGGVAHGDREPLPQTLSSPTPGRQL